MGRDIGLCSSHDGLSSSSWGSKDAMAIIRLLGHKSKTKDTFLSSTLKVWESKVSLFFWYMAQGLRYWHFFLWRWHVLLLLRFKRRNGHISAPGPQIKKPRTLSFLQLLKFEKTKYPYFFILWPRGRDIGLCSGHDGTSSSSWGSKDAMAEGRGFFGP